MSSTFFRLIFLSALLFSLVTFSACDKSDNGIAPMPADSKFDGAFLAPDPKYTAFLSSTPQSIKAKIAPGASGENLLRQAAWVYMPGVLAAQVPAVYDGIATTTATFPASYSRPPEWWHFVQVAFRSEMTVERIYAITPQTEQNFSLRYLQWLDDGSYVWVEYPIPVATFGPIIDVTLTSPVTSRYFVFSFGCGDGIPVTIGELEVFGPSFTPSIKIYSPAINSQFMIGENIQFSSSSSTNLVNHQWFSDGVLFGTTPGSPANSASNLSPGVHTIKVVAQKPSDFSEVSDSIDIEILAGFKIVTLGSNTINASIRETPMSSIKSNVQTHGEELAVSYRAAKTAFQAIGYRIDGSEIGQYPVDWEIQGGEVVASEQLRMGILSQLGQPNTRIGNIENSPVPVPGGSINPVLDSSQITFHSFLPGNMALVAKKGAASDSVAIRIKQPTFKVNVYPVGDVDTSIFDTWKNVVYQVWEKENIIKVESVNLMPAVSNVTYPEPPLIPPPEGSEASMPADLGLNPSYLNLLYHDYILGQTSGYFNVPRTSDFLISNRPLHSANVFIVRSPNSHWLDDSFSPPRPNWCSPDIVTVSARNYVLPIWKAGAIVSVNMPPYPIQYSRYLAAGIGNLFGLPQNAEWLNNLMDFSPIGGLEVAPEQYISALNYRADNPESSNFIQEE